MGFKVIVLVGLLLAMVILLSSEASGKDLADTSNAVDASAKPDQNGGYPGGGYGGRGGYGGGGRGGYGGGRGGGYCRYGRCCGRYNCRCCSYAGEKSDANIQGQPQN